MDKSLMGTFVLALILGFILGVLSCCTRFIFLNYEYLCILYMEILTIIRLAFNPFLIFTVFYLHGRKVDLKAKLGAVIVSLFAGLYVGNLLGHTVTFSVLTYLLQPCFSPSFSVMVLPNLLPTVIFSAFFVALSASAIAYIRNIKTSIEEKKENKK